MSDRKPTFTKEYLKRMHTGSLLRVLNNVQKTRSNMYSIISECLSERDAEPLKSEEEEFPEDQVKVYTENFGHHYTYGDSVVTLKDLKDELATREHIPNKIEAKQIRQEKAKQKKNRDRRGR